MHDELLMRRCFQLAGLGAGAVSPNPMVGAVLVYEGKIIGEGWHQSWGSAHAEVNCIRAVSADNQAFIPLSTLYCNLEPCAHYGKTPPCADLIIAHKIPKVVLSNTDPNPLVAGKGIAKLRQAGIAVQGGILAAEGQWLNRIFFHWVLEKRPYIMLKWAQTANGILGTEQERMLISGPESQRLAHRWRSECDAILVGNRTAMLDNPRLDQRLYFGKNPLRLALDVQGKIPLTHHLLDDSTPTWIFGPAPQEQITFKQTKFVEVEGRVKIPRVLDALKEANIASLMVEGGANLLEQFLDSGLWDEIRVLKNSQRAAGGVSAPKLPNHAVLREEFQVGKDLVRIFAREHIP